MSGSEKNAELPLTPPATPTVTIRVQQLEPPDSHRLNAASGWLELGCPDEALKELEELSESNRRHPDVLELAWLIHAALKAWDHALAAADLLIRIAPDRPAGWLHRAYAMRRVTGGGLDKAWTLLRPAFDRFPNESVIAYNLSCYACRMGRLEDSRRWLKRSIAIGNRDEIKRLALRDDDLRELWQEIRTL